MAETATQRARPIKRADDRVVGNLLRDLRAVTRRCDKADEVREAAYGERDRVIRDAHAAGLTPTELAEATGLTTKRIDQIRRGARL
jgi:hypothetical protein